MGNGSFAFRIPHSAFDPQQSTRRHERGVALLIVVSLLTVIGVMAVSFAFSMYLETQASTQFVSTMQARYLAEGGVSHARAVLEEDRLGTRSDDLTEAWAVGMSGGDVDVTEDGTRDARWWLIEREGEAVGRYAVVVSDEASKVNLNTALADPSPGAIGAVNLTTLLTRLGIPDARTQALAIEQYRYGPDEHPGIAFVDDDRDGAVDEPDEYQPMALRGDDRRFENVEEVAAIMELDGTLRERLAAYTTVYSWDPNVSLTGQTRLNLNTAIADELLGVLLDVGVENPWQVAVNMADYVDPDLVISRVSKSALRLSLNDQGPLGDWRWQTSPSGHYATDVADGSPLVWTASVPSGTFQILVHGVAGTKIGDVTIEGQTKRSMDSGESFGTLAVSGTVTVTVHHREPAPSRGAFGGIELVPEQPTPGIPITEVRGVEAIRINEAMVEPVLQLNVAEATFDPQTSGWFCPAGSSVCSNSGSGQARWTWVHNLARPGRYHVRVFGSQAGQTVGEVRVDGKTEQLIHGERHSSTITIGADKKVTVAIGKTNPDGTYYFQSVRLSLEPDGEYVELINLSDRDIALGGWTLDGEATMGRRAQLPADSVVKAHGLLVVAVDAEDAQEGLSGNGISVRETWELSEAVAVVQLEFPDGAPSADEDWLSTTVPVDASATLVLRSPDGIVDEVEYPIPLPTNSAFQSLEKGDPTVVTDDDQDTIDDGWYPSLQLYTPGQVNDNDGARELRGLEVIVHDATREITMLNRTLGSVGELVGLPSGSPWEMFSSEMLSKVVDRLTVESLALETEGRLIDGKDAWRETADGYEISLGAQSDGLGTWRWEAIPDGRYRLSLYGWTGEQVAVRWQLTDGVSYADWTPGRLADAQGRIVVGQLTVGMDGTPSNTLVLQARCESVSKICHLNQIRLDPQLIQVGKINVNTAPRDVLLALPGMTEAIADRVIANRPYGDQDSKARGIGDLLLGGVLGTSEEDVLANFRQLAHLVTTRSEVFQIISRGEGLQQDRPSATQRIYAIVQR